MTQDQYSTQEVEVKTRRVGGVVVMSVILTAVVIGAMWLLNSQRPTLTITPAVVVENGVNDGMSESNPSDEMAAGSASDQENQFLVVTNTHPEYRMSVISGAESHLKKTLEELEVQGIEQVHINLNGSVQDFRNSWQDKIFSSFSAQLDENLQKLKITLHLDKEVLESVGTNTMADINKLLDQMIFQGLYHATQYENTYIELGSREFAVEAERRTTAREYAKTKTDICYLTQSACFVVIQ